MLYIVPLRVAWKLDIQNKTSLKYVNFDSLIVGKSHHVWSAVSNSVYNSRRAQLKYKFMTGTCILQENRADFNQFQVNATFPLCSVAPETRQQFIGEYFYPQPERQTCIENLHKSPVFFFFFFFFFFETRQQFTGEYFYPQPERQTCIESLHNSTFFFSFFFFFFFLFYKFTSFTYSKSRSS